MHNRKVPRVCTANEHRARNRQGDEMMKSAAPFPWRLRFNCCGAGVCGTDTSLKWFLIQKYLGAPFAGSESSRESILSGIPRRGFRDSEHSNSNPPPTVAAFCLDECRGCCCSCCSSRSSRCTPLKERRRSTRELVVRKMAVRTSVTSIPIPSHQPPPHRLTFHSAGIRPALWHAGQSGELRAAPSRPRPWRPAGSSHKF